MTYSAEVLEATPTRATKLLNGIGAVPTIRTLLMMAGMTDADITEGRHLLLACLAAPLGEDAPTDTEDAMAQRAATAELDQWDEPNFARFGATLRRHHPDAADYVFRDLSASTGVVAVKGVATFLARLDALEGGTDPSRQASKTRKDDQKAVALLAKRGLDKAERNRLHKLVKVALGPTSPLPSIPQPLSDARREKLIALKSWYDEWGTTAKAVVKKKGDLIRLGLANRKSRAKAKAPAKTTGEASKSEGAAENGAGTEAPAADPGNGAGTAAPAEAPGNGTGAAASG